MKSVFIFLALSLMTLAAQAKLKVVATTADIAALVKIVGADKINISQIAKGSQDPHYIEAKPSFMVKMRDADLVIANGLSLEVGWLPTLIKGARNPNISPNSKGYLELGSLITPLEKPTGDITRAMGDVHPEGNPHFTLDPQRTGELAVKVAEKLSELDSAHKEFYQANAKKYQEAMTKKVGEWTARLKASGVKTAITYHPSMNYFMDSFFDTKIAERIAKEVPNSKVVTVGIAVDSLPELNSLQDVTEQIVKAIESAK